MLSDTDIPYFKYDEATITASRWWKNEIYGQHCGKCKKLYSEYELFPVRAKSGQTKYYCPDCIVGNVEWCNSCNEAFEIEDPSKPMKICKECAEGLCTNTSKNNLDQ